MMTDEERKIWLAIRKEAGLKIDPETAEVAWTYGLGDDQYEIFPASKTLDGLGRVYFARSPGSDVWVHFGDLPGATSHALWEKHGRKLGFPGGRETYIWPIR